MSVFFGFGGEVVFGFFEFVFVLEDGLFEHFDFVL